MDLLITIRRGYPFSRQLALAGGRVGQPCLHFAFTLGGKDAAYGGATRETQDWSRLGFNYSRILCAGRCTRGLPWSLLSPSRATALAEARPVGATDLPGGGCKSRRKFGVRLLAARTHPDRSGPAFQPWQPSFQSIWRMPRRSAGPWSATEDCSAYLRSGLVGARPPETPLQRQFRLASGRRWSRGTLTFAGCGRRCQPHGYGQFKHRGKPRLAHRVSWELTHGPIPPGCHLLHSCDQRSCVNPAHLSLGSHA